MKGLIVATKMIWPRLFLRVRNATVIHLHLGQAISMFGCGPPP
jgi:hypothetical protein